MVYCINRYLNKPKNFKAHSGYETILNYSEEYKVISECKFLSTILNKLIKSKPNNYTSITFSLEIKALFLGLITGKPIFYLYADKDAFILPIIKRKFKLSRLKLFGTLHWPQAESLSFSFYKNNLSSVFNGIITLSSNNELKISTKRTIIHHGIDLSFWLNDKISINENSYYLIIGQSNRNHKMQIEIIKKISQLEPNAKFIILINNSKIRKLYESIKNVKILKEKVSDIELKKLYKECKAVILIQNKCLASNVVMESIAMQRPILANNVGDIKEYIDLNFFINLNKPNAFLIDFCLSNKIRNQIINHFGIIRNTYDWKLISQKTLKFILKEC